MPKSITKLLTTTSIRGAPPAQSGTRDEYRDTKVGGLVLRVTDRGAKTFALYARFPPDNAPSRPALGQANKLTLAAARKKALAWLELIEQGIDPRQKERQDREEETQRRAVTFEAVATDWFKSISAQRKAREVERDVRRVFLTKWAKRPISDITPLDVRNVIVAVKEGGASAQAHNLLGYIRRLFDWAIEQRVYGLTASPVAPLKPKKLIGKKRKRRHVLSDSELRALWRAAEEMPYPYGPLFRMLALTGQRKSEVSDARWREFDLSRKLWLIPPERMKNENGHTVPLCDDALALLASLPRFEGADNDCLFSQPRTLPPEHRVGKRGTLLAMRKRRGTSHPPVPGHKPVNGFSKAKSRLDEAMAVELGGPVKPFVIHDIRRTFRTGLSALRIDLEVREMLIAHAQPELQQIYDQHTFDEEKREALAKWERRLRDIVDPPVPVDNVLHFRGA